MMKITKLVSNIVLGRGCIRELKAFAGELLPDRSGYDVFIVDSVHRNTGTWDQLTPDSGDLMMAVDVSAHEPKTEQVDELCGRIREEKGDALPRVVIGIGGGSAMDTAKAVSVMLTNPGSSADYQGWDRVKEKAVPKIAVPTLAGTGAEASRTAVLSGPVRKLGINSEQSMFNGVLMDPDLLESADPEQAFYTGMDGFIHAVEALNGSAINAMGRPFAEKSKEAIQRFFSGEGSAEELMVGSYLGGASIANSSVGVCHALSYGVSFYLGYRHGIANAIVFQRLEEFYGRDVEALRAMALRNGIELPQDVTAGVSSATLDKMAEMAYLLERDLISALGEDYRRILPPERIVDLYRRM